MSRWTKETALQELETLIQQVDQLKRSRRRSAEHMRWLVRTVQFIEQVFGGSSLYYLSIHQLHWHEAGSLIVPAWNFEEAIELRHQEAYLRDLDTAKGLLMAAYDELSSTSLQNVYQGKSTAAEASGILKVLAIVERKLRKTIREQPAKEKEIQDALENLFIGADLEYSRETESIEYSSKTYVPDFSMPRLDLAIEVKLSARPDREKEIIAEINDDVLAYKQKYGNILFVVYDVGFIRDVDRFVGSLEETEGVVVKVVKH